MDLRWGLGIRLDIHRSLHPVEVKTAVIGPVWCSLHTQPGSCCTLFLKPDQFENLSVWLEPWSHWIDLLICGPLWLGTNIPIIKASLNLQQAIPGDTRITSVPVLHALVDTIFKVLKYSQESGFLLFPINFHIPVSTRAKPRWINSAEERCAEYPFKKFRGENGTMDFHQTVLSMR